MLNHSTFSNLDSSLVASLEAQVSLKIIGIPSDSKISPIHPREPEFLFQMNDQVLTVVSSNKNLLMHICSMIILDVQIFEDLNPWITLCKKEQLQNHFLLVSDLENLFQESTKLNEIDQKHNCIKRQFKALFPNLEIVKRNDKVLIKAAQKASFKSLDGVALSGRMCAQYLSLMLQQIHSGQPENQEIISRLFENEVAYHSQHFQNEINQNLRQLFQNSNSVNELQQQSKEIINQIEKRFFINICQFPKNIDNFIAFQKAVQIKLYNFLNEISEQQKQIFRVKVQQAVASIIQNGASNSDPQQLISSIINQLKQYPDFDANEFLDQMIPCMTALLQTYRNKHLSECQKSELAQIQLEQNRIDFDNQIRSQQLQLDQLRNRLDQEKTENRHMLSNQQEIEQQERRIWERERSQNQQLIRWQENEMQIMDKKNRDYEKKILDFEEKFRVQKNYQQQIEDEIKEIQQENSKNKLELLREKQRFLQIATEKTELEIQLRNALDKEKISEHQNKQEILQKQNELQTRMIKIKYQCEDSKERLIQSKAKETALKNEIELNIQENLGLKQQNEQLRQMIQIERQNNDELKKLNIIMVQEADSSNKQAQFLESRIDSQNTEIQLLKIDLFKRGEENAQFLRELKEQQIQNQEIQCQLSTQQVQNQSNLENHKKTVDQLKKCKNKQKDYEERLCWLERQNGPKSTHQLSSIISEIQDQRSMQQTLLKTLQSSPNPKENELFLMTQPRVENEKLQISRLEEKVARLKKFKTIVSQSLAYQCKHCLQLQEQNLFLEHIKDCSSIEQPKLQLFEQDGKSFKIVIGQGSTQYTLNKKMQQIVELRNALTPFNLNLESAKIFQINDKSILNGENQTVKEILTYKQVWKSEIMRQFLTNQNLQGLTSPKRLQQSREIDHSQQQSKDPSINESKSKYSEQGFKSPKRKTLEIMNRGPSPVYKKILFGQHSDYQVETVRRYQSQLGSPNVGK